MLVLSRYTDESLTIQHAGVEFRILVIGNRNGIVRLGFDAPPEVVITRTELIGTGKEFPPDHRNYRARRTPPGRGIGFGDA